MTSMASVFNLTNVFKIIDNRPSLIQVREWSLYLSCLQMSQDGIPE